MTQTVPISIDDPVNAAILRVSEDGLTGFLRDPIRELAQRSGVEAPVVIERLAAMLLAGTIRRVRQTLSSTRLARGALVAWDVPAERLDAAFNFMFRQDPFTGHVVVRSTDRACAGSHYKLWTTLKVPPPFSPQKHCEYLARQAGCAGFIAMPARQLFTLGVGHLRRRQVQPGERAEQPGRAVDTDIVRLSHDQWRVLEAMKREFEPQEITLDAWASRADEAGVSHEAFCRTGEELAARGLVGRFSTFLEHVKPLRDGTTVTRYNALFHWAVPPGRETAAGLEVGRHAIMTHAYWRDAGPAFNHVNVMGVAHGSDKDHLLDHKAAIDAHLREAGLDVRYTAVFWGGRSEIKPSEISSIAYRDWCAARGLAVRDMLEE